MVKNFFLELTSEEYSGRGQRHGQHHGQADADEPPALRARRPGLADAQGGVRARRGGRARREERLLGLAAHVLQRDGEGGELVRPLVRMEDGHFSC